MTKRPKISRPEPQRTAPIRSWTARRRATKADPPGSRAAREPSERGVDPISDGVAQAYRVIDEFVALGRRAAGDHPEVSFGSVFTGPGAQSGPSGSSMEQLAERTLEPLLELTTLWLELLGRSGPAKTPASAPEPAAPQSAAPEPAAPPPAPTPDSTLRPKPLPIRVAIQSRRRAELQVALHAEADPATISANRLRPSDANEAFTPIDVRCVPDEREYLFELAVSDEQAPGRYNGMLVDTLTGLPVGTLSLLLDP